MSCELVIQGRKFKICYKLFSPREKQAGKILASPQVRVLNYHTLLSSIHLNFAVVYLSLKTH